MNPAPAEVVSASVGAVAAQHRQHDRERIRQAEQRCAQLIDRTWRWIDRRPALAEAGAELFAAQVISLRRVPADVAQAGEDEVERWILDRWAERGGAA